MRSFGISSKEQKSSMIGLYNGTQRANSLSNYVNINKSLMKCILILMVQLQIWDGLITQIFVNGGFVREANPFITSLVSSGQFLPLKIVVALACMPILWAVYKHVSKLALLAASGMVVLYIAVIFWNFMILFNVI
jgi:hypothetical protein